MWCPRERGDARSERSPKVQMADGIDWFSRLAPIGEGGKEGGGSDMSLVMMCEFSQLYVSVAGKSEFGHICT